MLFRRALAAATTLFVALNVPAQADIPRTLNVQLRLEDPSGAPKPDGSHAFVFRLYDVATGGAPLWEESRSLNTTGGLASHSLGSSTPFPPSLAFDKPYYIGVRVGTDAEMAPRLSLQAAPYAFSGSGSGSGFSVPHEATASVSGYLLHLRNTDSGESTDSAGIRGDGPTGVYGEGTRSGVYGRSDATEYSLGVYGLSSTGDGVLGSSFAGSATPFSGGVGVRAYTTGDNGFGIYAEALGVGSTGIFGYGVNRGLEASASNAGGYGVIGRAKDTASGTGVHGSGATRGVDGYSASGVGVYGLGVARGVEGYATSGPGLYGQGTTGVFGQGSRGVEGASSASYGPGVLGIGTGDSGYGVYGQTTVSNGVGVYGSSTAANGQAIVGIANSGSSSVGVFGVSSGGYAGYFNGKVHVNGNLSKASGSFKIDHPLDPANKYLYHSFVESPDMKNIYDGIVTTDASGEATVLLPEYFEALNSDFRYQLTAIGQFAQAIVSREVEGNAFAIRTDKPNVKVSWQVTGIRQDTYAREHRIPVEEAKPQAERGSYLYSSNGDAEKPTLLRPHSGEIATVAMPDPS